MTEKLYFEEKKIRSLNINRVSLVSNNGLNIYIKTATSSTVL